ncbi:MAG: hypothetical protein RI904_1388 [Pseudomonadota bacterium]
MEDLVIRGATLVDGSGATAYTGDLAIKDGVITQVGGRAGAAKREIQADGCIVAPGWIDVHTHYDGQATWDPYLSPSTWHGVTTAIMGNCGMGFAPVHTDRRDWLIKVMEGVEDIPGSVLHEGLQWDWETFPEYLDALERRSFALDVGAQIPHSAVRAYVMGDRAIHHDEATPKDLVAMRDIVREGMKAGAMGFSTTRTFIHKYDERKYPPGTFATADEITGLGSVLGEVGHGVFQMTSNHPAMGGEIPWLYQLANRPCSRLVERYSKNTGWRSTRECAVVRRNLWTPRRPSLFPAKFTASLYRTPDISIHCRPAARAARAKNA